MENTDKSLPRIPVSTYRLQFNHTFGFNAAGGIVSYLHDLGISDVYASPYFKARKGSLHGYDIVDPSALNPEVGTEEEYDTFIQEIGKYGMGQILDIVPNHMSCESENPWWMDVLENGQSSTYADFFDIDWHPVIKKLSGKLHVPVLGDQYGKVLESQELKLRFEEGAFFIYYQDLKFPMLPETYVLLLDYHIEHLRNLVTNDDPHLTELLSIVTALKHLPSATGKNRKKIGERYREKEIIKKRLLTLYLASSEIKKFIDDNVDIFNGKKGDPRSFNLLDGLLAKQVWRLSHWRVADEEINYRRFFDINALAAIRIEEPHVFRETHKLIFRLIAEKKITGLRVDHPDGLYNPSDYFEKLQRECFRRLVSTKAQGGDDHEQSDLGPEVLKRYQRLLSSYPRYRPFYIIGEKILTGGDKIPEDWAIFGTTGYAFLNSLNGIFVERKNAKIFDNLYAQFAGTNNHFSDVVYEKKKLVAQVAMSGEINTLGHYLNNISEKNRHTRDFTLNSLTKAVTEIIAFFPVYRTYINSWTINDRDRQHIETAVSKAKRKNPAISVLIFDFVGAVLLLEFPVDFSEEDKKEWLDFVMKFQQITAPVMAKGVEDTTFYVYNRLISLNEVGGSPDRFGLSLEAFHGQNLDRLKFWPLSLITTSTHDSKRSEDVRARINVLSEVPDKWRERLKKWSYLNKMKKTVVEGQDVPDHNEECLLYQTLIGAWPLGHPEETAYDAFKKRIKDYIIKALREAKVNTSWINPKSDYEDSVMSFIDAILTLSADNKFPEEFRPFQKTISYFGMLNSLSQTLLKITCPGVPDFYQGTEIWDFSLCDPDNRRPVDFNRRRTMLTSLKENMAKYGPDLKVLLKELIEQWEDGTVKLYVTSKALAYRGDNHMLFMEGTYIPLTAEGELKDQVCAFARQRDNKTALVIVPRFMAQVLRFTVEAPFGEKVWAKTGVLLPDEISDNIFNNVLTAETVEVIRRAEKRVLALADVFSCFPVAMLEGTMDFGSEKQTLLNRRQNERRKIL
jgi:(1->4)-alpha-D-glucan 1-alpha-D-glucosylmutase